jgi:hypothetical protein
LTVTDDDGATASTSKQVTVTAPQFLARDLFNRTVTGGLGTADVGGPWTTISGGSRLSVAAGSAVFRHNAAANQNEAVLNAVSTKRADLRVTLAADAVVNGNGTYVTIQGRRVNATTRYDAKFRWLSGNRWEVWLSAQKGSATATNLTTAMTVPGTFTPGAKLKVRLQVLDATATSTTVRVKAWADGTSEPATWSRTATDTYAPLQVPGAVGVTSYLASNATTVPISIRLSDLSVETVP